MRCSLSIAVILAALAVVGSWTPGRAAEDGAKESGNAAAGAAPAAALDPVPVVVTAPSDRSEPTKRAPDQAEAATAAPPKTVTIEALPVVDAPTPAVSSPSPATGAPAPTEAQIATPPPPQAPAQAADALGDAIRARLADAMPKSSDIEKEDRAAVTAYYSAPGTGALWVDQSGFNARGRAVVAEIQDADSWGLRAADFSVPKLDAAGGGESKLADAEIKLTLAVLKYARHARGGRIADPTSQLSSYLDRKPQLRAPKVVLDEIAAASDGAAYLRGLHPKHDQFVKLRAQLLQLKGAAKAEKAVVKVPQGPKILPGKSHPDIAIIRKRLNVPVPAADGAPADETVYDEALVKAVKALQVDSGITPANGTITQATRTAMNGGGEAPAPNARKVTATLESWRWMPDDLGDLYVWVNIPEYTVRVVKNGAVIHSERVITGKVDTQTPIFSDVMRTVVIHPFWHVPESIKVKELWPGLARGGDTLSKNGLRAQFNGRDVDPRDVDWTQTNIRNYQVFQPPGPSNVLGVVKFLFPNKHQVYMHDTPTKHLFSQSQRTFSHGCMRVRNPVRLAEVLLQEDKGWEPAKLAQLIKSGPQNNEIALTRKIPVHVTYMTTWVDDAGKLGAARDIYGHEERVTLALDGQWAKIARGKDHLAPVKAEPISRLAESSKYAQPTTALGDFFKNLFGAN